MVKNPQTDVQKITVATGQRPRRHKNNNMTFEQVPSAMEKMQAMLATIQSKIDALALQQDWNEPPISPKVLRERLAISEPTEIRMRKRMEIPFLEVGGHYRYIWADVLKALAKKKTYKAQRQSPPETFKP